MTTRPRPAAYATLAAAVLSVTAAFAVAQNAAPAPDAVEERFRRLEQQVEELRQQVQQRDATIADLQRRSATAPAAPMNAPADVARTQAAVARDAGAQRQKADFNPSIAVIVDSLATFSTRRENDAYNRFDVREVELDLRSPVGPRADGVVVLAIERDVENPVFAEAGEEEGGGIDTAINIEDAYLNIYDTGVPGLSAKLGRFHVKFGRQNLLHLHDLPTYDPPLVNQAFLAPESLTDAGVSLSYLIPPQYVGNQAIEVTLEILSGEGADSESPTLGGSFEVDSPAFNTHVLWNTDLADNVNFELGGSWLTGKGSADNDHNVNLFGLDATLVRRDPTGGFNNQLLQAEAIYGIVDSPDSGDTNHSWGAYVLAQQQINADFYVGLRGDYTQNPNDDSQEAWGGSAYVTWYYTEFMKFRAQYQYRHLEDATENVFGLQATWIFGAHPPHPYWAMK
jgi:hypothetical protein